ncbi:MAG: thermonuclease family protein [Thermaerobacter sp.]|nr:thermonuclease family protein [Thermaerobacter sp.]
MTKKTVFLKVLATMVCIGLLVSVAAFAGLPQAEATIGNTFTASVQSVQDGDTIHLQQPILGTTEVRLVGIDAPETFTVENHAPGNQVVPHGNASRDFLRSLLPHGTEITVVTDKVQTDGFGRVLAYVHRGTLDVNRELLRQGNAVTHVIWPNTYSRFSEFRSALLEARTAGRGMWNPANPIQELPFEYRLRVFNRQFERFVGDFLTKTYVSPADYRIVLVENRVQFATEQEAVNAGYARSVSTGPQVLFINELLPNASREWIEIFNSSISDINIGGYIIDDLRPGGSAPFTIPAGTIIRARGFFVWETSAYFNNTGDDANLIAPNGTVIDRFSFTSTSLNRSFVRLPDGGPWSSQMDATPTRGASNN